MLSPIFESHAHYDDEAFAQDREQLLSTLKEHGIGTVINVGASISSMKKAYELARIYDYIYAAVGVHPNETAELTEQDIQWMKKHSTDSKVVAIGEIGLDYHWDEPERSVQKHWFSRQLQLAQEVSLPVIIHSREAAKDTWDIMQAEHARDLTGVIHCYSYSKETARDYLNIGYFFGIGGVVTFQNAKKLKEAVEYIPIEHILLETDSPYLAPVPNRGKRNSSLNLPYIAQAIADLKHMDAEEVVRITNDNSHRLFTKCQDTMVKGS